MHLKGLDDLRERMVDIVLVFFGVLAFAIVILNVFRAQEFGYRFSLLLQFILLPVLTLSAVLRKSLNMMTKVVVLTVILTIALLAGVISWGFLASAKLLIVVLPLFLAFTVSSRVALITLALMMTSYAVVAALYIKGVLVYDYDLVAYATGMRAWAIDFFGIFLGVGSFIVMARKMTEELNSSLERAIEQSSQMSEAQKKYKVLFETSNDAITLLKDGVFFDCNPKAEELFQFKRDEFITLTVADVSPEFQPDGQRSEEKAKNLVAGALGGKPTSFDWVHLKKDGSSFDVSVGLSAVYLDNEEYVQGVLRDITERKRVIRELESSEERHKKLVDSFPDIIMISDLNGHIFWGNENLQKITGITPDDYNNLGRKARIHPDDVHIVSRAITKLMAKGDPSTPVIENRFIDNDGKVHWFSGTISKLVLEGQMYLQTVSRDITQLKNTQLELEEHQNHLEKKVLERTKKLEDTLEELKATQSNLIQSEKMASLGVLTAGVAHEINNPLNYIMGGYVGLQAHFDELNSELNEDIPVFLNSIKVGVDRAADIVQGLNQFSRTSEVYSEDCDIHEILDNCLTMVHNQLKQRVDVVKDLYDGPALIKGNVGKLHQVFINLMTNASQAIDGEGEIHLSTRWLDGRLQVELRDNGCGIEAEHLSRITDPFFTTRDPGQGTGLGLSIAYNAVEDHGGQMTFESLVGEGTKVTVELPEGDQG